MFRLIANFVLAAAAVLPLAGQAQAQALPEIKLGYAKCAHCTPLSLTPENATGVKLEAIAFSIVFILLPQSLNQQRIDSLLQRHRDIQHYVTAGLSGSDQLRSQYGSVWIADDLS